MFHFVYITTNLLNGKQYIGDHSTNDLNDSYLGSGDYLKKSIKKYGKESFKREILEIFESKKEAYEAQEKFIILHNTLFPFGYNISPRGGYGRKNSFLSEKTKKKMKGRIPWNKNIKTGNLSEETKKRMSKAKKGKLPWNTNKIYTDEQKKNFIGRIPWNKGKTNVYSAETIEKLRKSYWDKRK